MEKRDPMATLTQSFTMSGGDGTHSYARNSLLQKRGIFSTMKKIGEAIAVMFDLPNPYFDLNILRIADLGCSVGPNTFYVVKHIIDIAKLKYEQENNLKDLEFHVFFNDQLNNDFNTLFRNLPVNEKYHVAGVPGSFYSRVFPRNSLHIAYSSYALHWLSRAPKNGGKHNSEAHREQFKKDIEDFLEGRAEELVPGGLLIILGLCTSDGVPFAQTGRGMIKEIFLNCVIDITDSGVKRDERVELFNLPVYYPQFHELKEVIEQKGGFSIEVMEEIKHPYEDVSVTHDLVVSMYRGVYHGVIVEHFGQGFVDELFDRFSKKLTKHVLEVFRKSTNDSEYIIALKRNVL